MPADIIKFGKARKAKTATDKAQQAIANRAKFGRSKAERDREAANDALNAKRHRALKLLPARHPDGDRGDGMPGDDTDLSEPK